MFSGYGATPVCKKYYTKPQGVEGKSGIVVRYSDEIGQNQPWNEIKLNVDQFWKV